MQEGSSEAHALENKMPLTIGIHVPAALLLCQTPHTHTDPKQRTQDTTLPLKQGSLALSSEISSFTTLKKKDRRKVKRLKRYQISKVS